MRGHFLLNQKFWRGCMTQISETLLPWGYDVIQYLLEQKRPQLPLRCDPLQSSGGGGGRMSSGRIFQSYWAWQIYLIDRTGQRYYFLLRAVEKLNGNFFFFFFFLPGRIGFSARSPGPFWVFRPADFLFYFQD